MDSCVASTQLKGHSDIPFQFLCIISVKHPSPLNWVDSRVASIQLKGHSDIPLHSNYSTSNQINTPFHSMGWIPVLQAFNSKATQIFNSNSFSSISWTLHSTQWSRFLCCKHSTQRPHRYSILFKLFYIIPVKHSSPLNWGDSKGHWDIPFHSNSFASNQLNTPFLSMEWIPDLKAFYSKTTQIFDSIPILLHSISKTLHSTGIEYVSLWRGPQDCFQFWHSILLHEQSFGVEAI